MGKKKKGSKTSKNKKIIIFSIVFVSSLIILTSLGFAVKNMDNIGNIFGFPIKNTEDLSESLNENLNISIEEETNKSEEDTTEGNSSNVTNTTEKSSSGGGGGGGGGCTASCGGNVCGSDGCGGSCGTCGIWETCSAGSCVLSCTNDAGCSSAGSFCDGNVTYSCSLEANGCYNRTNITECSSSEKCYTGSCSPFININSCQEIAESDTIYILNESIENNSLVNNCIQITNESITLDCEGNSINSTQDFAGVYSNQSNIIIQNCSISMGENSGYGIEIVNASNVSIKNCTLNSQYAGVIFTSVTNSTITNSTINNNLNKGIYLLDSVNNTIRYNTITNGSFYGVYFANSSENTLEDNILISNEFYGLLIDASPGGSNTIRGNQIKSSQTNVYIKTSNNIIENNFINGSTSNYGIRIYMATNNTLKNNTVTYSATHGIQISKANNNTVINNTVNFNQQYGIEFYGTSANNTVQGNNFCSSITLDVSCAINQLFGIGNKCSPIGATCGGTCEVC